MCGPACPRAALAVQVREKDELLPPGYFDDQEPDEEEYEGYTGNAGATLDRQAICGVGGWGWVGGWGVGVGG